MIREGVVESYDDVPYTDHAYAESHPERLALVARLNRFEPPGLESARVLEIACARGGNLLPMAAGMPRATFVGVDPSRRQIDEAIEIARGAGLDNVSFRAEGFEALGRAEFDFVIAHGLWSWISPGARRELLRTIASVLAPRGIAYVSFNVLPGWYERLAARDFLRAFATPATAKRALGDLVALVSPEHAAYKASLARVASRIGETDEAYVTHEYFSAEHHPATVGEFLDEAGAAGLRYLGDAIPQETAFELAPPELLERAKSASVRDAQQLLDFVRGAAFRRALLVRADASDWAWSPSLDADALDAMTATSRFRASGVPGELLAGDLTVHIDDAMRPAIAAIDRAAPRAAAIDPAWRREVFDLWLSTRAIDLHLHAPPIADVSATPRACPVARWHALHGGPVTNRWHHEVVLAEDLTRLVLAELDGTRAPGAIARDLGQSPAIVAAAVRQLASLALLVPE